MANNDIPQFPEVPDLVDILGIDKDTFLRADEYLGIQGMLNSEDIDNTIDTWFDPLVEYGWRDDAANAAANENMGRRNLAANVHQPGQESLVVRNPVAGYKPGDYLSSAPSRFDQDPAYVEVPTATTNPLRPRTVAASYNKREKTLTVMFFDGTLYNYYLVTPEEWDGFKLATDKQGRASKGQYIKDTLDKKSRGFADVTALPEDVRSLARSLARAAQMSAAKEKGWKPPTVVKRAARQSKKPKPITPTFGGKGKIRY